MTLAGPPSGPCGNLIKDPAGAELHTGLHVGEDPVRERSSETIGYVVVESGIYHFDGKTVTVGVGEKTVRSVVSGSYSYLGEATLSVLSTSGMNGGDGHWPLLLSPASVGGKILLAIDEDITSDSERIHSYEQITYLLIK